MEQQHHQGQPPYIADDEIDLFELVETIWKGKWIVVAVVCCALLLGAIFVMIKPTVYEVKIPFNVNFSSISPVAAATSVALVTDKTQSNFVFNGMDEGLLASATKILNDAIEKATAMVVSEAKNEIYAIQNQLPVQFLSTEIVASRYLNSLKIIQMSEDESVKILSIKNGTQTVKSPKIALTLALASVAGLMLGVMIVLFRQAILNRRERNYMLHAEAADTTNR